MSRYRILAAFEVEGPGPVRFDMDVVRDRMTEAVRGCVAGDRVVVMGRVEVHPA